MRFSRIIISFVFLAALCGWGALYAVFYYTPDTMGTYPVIDTGAVRGAAVQRFHLPQDEIFITSRRAGKPYDADVLILAQDTAHGSNHVYIVRNNVELLFDQRLATSFTAVSWVPDIGFRVAHEQGTDAIIFAASDTGYAVSIQ